MKKILFRTAIISSPILALIAAVPIYIIDGSKFHFFVNAWLTATFFVAIIWAINIFVLLKFDYLKKRMRYFVTTFIVLIAQAINISVITYFEIQPRKESIFFPFIGAIALNSIIIIISNSIILQFQKESAELEVERLKVINLEAQKQILLQQLQPHFLFNALSTLKSLITENPLNAVDYTLRLSDFLRYSVQAKNNEVVSLAEELKFTKDYFDLQKVRFGDALQFTIDIDISHFEKKIPVYAIQTLVENAIKHNAFTDKKPINISISLENNKIKVQNNKVSKTLVLPSGTGLENLNMRYKMISETEIEIRETNEYFTVLLNLL